MEQLIENTMKNLEKNGMQPFYAENREAVLPIVQSLLHPGDSVSHGGSVTLSECGITALLANGDYDYIDRSKYAPENVREAFLKAFACDSYLTSSNAVTERGELYNVDGNSNRVACIVYGPKQVIVIVGKNKIVPDINAAIRRVKEKAAPPNCVRLGIPSACSKLGKCVSLTKEDPFLCDGCAADIRICCNYVVSAKQREKNRIKVIIVNESLGY
ncbi:MAG: lactate utilization protein [Eubacterium sp.]|nr:lactate utilization protein [Eubacterium sp.]